MLDFGLSFENINCEHEQGVNVSLGVSYGCRIGFERVKDASIEGVLFQLAIYHALEGGSVLRT